MTWLCRDVWLAAHHAAVSVHLPFAHPVATHRAIGKAVRHVWRTKRRLTHAAAHKVWIKAQVCFLVAGLAGLGGGVGAAFLPWPGYGGAGGGSLPAVVWQPALVPLAPGAPMQVPEPSSLVVLLGGVAGIVATRRRQR